MKNWKVWTAFLTVFATGIIVGVVGVGLVIQQHFERPRDMGKFHTTMRARLVKDIVDTVQPDESAIPAIREAVDETLAELEKVRTDTQPRVKAILEKGRKRIIAHLTPEQAVLRDRMAEERKRGKFGFFRLPPPPPPFMPPLP